MDSQLVKKAKEGKRKLKAKTKRLKELIGKVQSLFAFAVLFHTLAISYFKAIIVYMLRFHCKLNENQAILSFHLFQASSYFSAYILGIFMTYSPMLAILLMCVCYLIGGGTIGYALLVMPHKENLIQFIPLALVVFGVGVGTFKSLIPKVLSPQNSPNVFLGCVLFELIVEALLVGVAQMFLDDLNVYVLLGLYGASAVLIITASIEPMTNPKHLTEKTFKYGNVMRCTIYGLWMFFMTGLRKLIKKKGQEMGIPNDEEEDEIIGTGRKSKKKKKNAKSKGDVEEEVGADVGEAEVLAEVEPIKEETEQKHWLYMAEKKFGKELVEALIVKFTLHKFYFWISGVWVGVELKYSYWIFTSYLTDRRFFSFVIHPAQYLALYPFLACLAIPMFAYYLAPALSKSYYNSGTRQMCMGAFFVLFSTAFSWQLSARLSGVSTEFMEADLSQTRVRVLNGHFCPSGIVYYFPMDPQIAQVIFAKPAIETAFQVDDNSSTPVIGPKKKIHTIATILTPEDGDSFLKYAKLPLPPEQVGTLEKDIREPTDSFGYLMNVEHGMDHVVTLSAYGYCETLHSFTLVVPHPVIRREVGFVDVFLMYKENNSMYSQFSKLEFERHPKLKPGLRMYLISEKPVEVELIRGDSDVLTTISDKTKKSEIIWLEVGDGPNLKIKSKTGLVKFTHVLGVAEMVELIVEVKDKVAAKMVHMQPPFNVSALSAVPQYLAVSVGEFLLGVVGLQYLILHAPQRMQYFVFLDWYLMLGSANIAIIIINQLPWFSVVFHAQLSSLTVLVAISYAFLIVMALRY